MLRVTLFDTRCTGAFEAVFDATDFDIEAREVIAFAVDRPSLAPLMLLATTPPSRLQNYQPNRNNRNNVPFAGDRCRPQSQRGEPLIQRGRRLAQERPSSASVVRSGARFDSPAPAS